MSLDDTVARSDLPRVTKSGRSYLLPWSIIREAAYVVHENGFVKDRQGFLMNELTGLIQACERSKCVVSSKKLGDDAKEFYR